jgi:lactoylglutathione lyase
MAMAVRLNHMSAPVRSLEVSAKFFQEGLQLPEIECGARKTNIRWFALGDGQSVHLIEGEFGRTFVALAPHFCISSFALDRTTRHLTAKGAKLCNLTGEVATNSRDGVRGVYLLAAGWALN